MTTNASDLLPAFPTTGEPTAAPVDPGLDGQLASVVSRYRRGELSGRDLRLARQVIVQRRLLKNRDQA